MDDVTQFISSVESKARKILAEQNKKQAEQCQRERVAIAKERRHRRDKNYIENKADEIKKNIVSREDLQALYNGTLSHSLGEVTSSTSSMSVLPHIMPQTNSPSSPTHSSPTKLSNQHQKSLPLLNDPQYNIRKARQQEKLMKSPLFTSLSKGTNNKASNVDDTLTKQSLRKSMNQIDQLQYLLKKMGVKNSNHSGINTPFASTVPAHGVEKRMCNACWTDPSKISRCEHTSTKFIGSNKLGVGLEAQGPISWLSDDLYSKYRSESHREALWEAYLAEKNAIQQSKKEQHSVVIAEPSGLYSPASSQIKNVSNGWMANPETPSKQQLIPMIPVLTRHPIFTKLEKWIEEANLITLSASRKRNLRKTFIFDVNHIWLTNLDHFNEKVSHQSTNESYMPNKDTDCNHVPSLSDRRDERAIREGYSQIQSIALNRALQHAVKTEISRGYSNRLAPQQRIEFTPIVQKNLVQRYNPDNLPLSLLGCGHYPSIPSIKLDISLDKNKSSLELVPGVSILWRSQTSAKPFCNIPRVVYDDSQVVAIFSRDSNSRCSTNPIYVQLVLAVEAPILAPLCFAWCGLSSAPQLYENVDVLTESLCISQILGLKNDSSFYRFELPALDLIYPCSLVILNGIAVDLDNCLELTEPYGHRRYWDEFQDDPYSAFRQKFVLPISASIPLNHNIEPHKLELKIAYPNVPGVCGRFCYRAIDPITQTLCYQRQPKDYVELITNYKSNGSNDPQTFYVSLKHETMSHITSKALSKYMAEVRKQEQLKEYEAKVTDIQKKIEAGRLVLEAKRREQQRLADEIEGLKMKKSTHQLTSSVQSSETLSEWQDLKEQSNVVEERNGWQMRQAQVDNSLITFFTSENEFIPLEKRFSWTSPESWEKIENRAEKICSVVDTHDVEPESRTSTSSTVDQLESECARNKQEIQSIAATLLEDDAFLIQLKEKLGLHIPETLESLIKESTVQLSPDQEKTSLRNGIHDEILRSDAEEQLNAIIEEPNLMRAKIMVSKLAKLGIAASLSRQQSTPGEGWKRLRALKLRKNFSRSVYETHTEGTRANELNRTNKSALVGILEPKLTSEYEQPDYTPDLKVQLIPEPIVDLDNKKLNLIAYEQSAGIVNSLITTSATKQAQEAITVGQINHNTDMLTMDEMVDKAMSCCRNANMDGLKSMLDAGIDINASDNNGNSLFIVACQQGNKRLAKYLIRRQCNMDYQNVNGNTALHYLYEYNHIDLAEYVKSKGASDIIPNASGLTCYEGLSVEAMEAI